MTMMKKNPPPPDREKAAKIAMLLTSNQPGEVTAAAGRLVSMLSAVGMTPADLILCDETEASFTTPHVLCHT